MVVLGGDRHRDLATHPNTGGGIDLHPNGLSVEVRGRLARVSPDHDDIAIGKLGDLRAFLIVEGRGVDVLHIGQRRAVQREFPQQDVTGAAELLAHQKQASVAQDDGIRQFVVGVCGVNVEKLKLGGNNCGHGHL